jgi:FtsH-binding integral membrane protein
MSFFSNTSAESRPLPSELDLGMIMRQVYTWLALGLVVCFGIAFVLSNAAGVALQQAVNGNVGALNETTYFLFNPIVWLVSLVVYLILAFALQPIIMRANPTVGVLFFLLFTGVFGFMMSTIFLAYAPSAIIAAFVATAGMFGAMTLIGYTTKTDLSKFGSILLMALIGLLIATVVNLFLNSGVLYMLISYAGVLIFAGLTAYDTQWIKNNAGSVAGSGDRVAAQRIALIGAFHLFLDFVNLFLFLLQLFGGGRRS